MSLNFIKKNKNKFFILILVTFLSLILGLTSIIVIPAEPEIIVISPQKNQTQIYKQCTPLKKTEQLQPLDKNGMLKVLVWNIYKQNRRQSLLTLENYAQDRDLVLLQEASLSVGLKSFIDEFGFNANMANAFEIFKTASGVMTMAKVNPISSCDFFVPEPWIRLPKSAIVSKYLMSNGQELLVLNLHAINFSWQLHAFQQQLDEAIIRLKAHHGPIIVGGDFNTWREARVAKVMHLAKDIGLKEIVFAPDNRKQILGLSLDHIYIRGLELVGAYSPKTLASDHNPLFARFKIINYKD